MAPFRASRSTRSGRPGGPSDHDIFDGLPVRQWELQNALLGPNDELNGDAGKAAVSHDRPEIPMPKGSELYPPWSLQLLRAARSGKVFRTHDGNTARTGKTAEKENGTDDARPEEAQRGVKRGPQGGYVATKWTQVPKHLEGPEREFLAKRRKGLLAPQSGRSGTTAGSVDMSQMRKTKVRRPDEDGQPQVLEVMVPEGQTVEGELKEEVTLENAGGAISAPAPGTVVEGLGVANEYGVVVATEGVMPIKKRPMPVGRRKKKGGKKISSSGGLGVSASAEAFREQQLRAQNAAGTSELGGDAAQADSAMTGTNEAEEEEGSEEDDDDDEEEEEDGEGDATQEERGTSALPETSGEASAIVSNAEEPVPVVHPEQEAGKAVAEEPKEPIQDEAPAELNENPPKSPQLVVDVHPEVTHQEPTIAPIHEPPKAEADERIDVETQEDAKDETFRDAGHEARDDAVDEALLVSEPQSDPKDELQSTPPQDLTREPTPPPQEDSSNVALKQASPKTIEKIEDKADQTREPEDENEDSSDTPTRPSPEPLSPYSLTPENKGSGSPVPAPIEQPTSVPAEPVAMGTSNETSVEVVKPLESAQAPIFEAPLVTQIDAKGSSVPLAEPSNDELTRAPPTTKVDDRVPPVGTDMDAPVMAAAEAVEKAAAPLPLPQEAAVSGDTRVPDNVEDISPSMEQRTEHFP